MKESLVDGMVMLRMALAALLSGAVSGLLVPTPFVLVFMMPRLAADGGPGLGEVAILLGAGALAGLILASGPAFAAGATLWSLQGRYERARRLDTWAGVGAGVGAFFWGLLEALMASLTGRYELDGTKAPMLAAFLAAGAGAALAFRAAMRFASGSRRDLDRAISAAPSGSPRRASHIRRSNRDSRP